jgi:hypothetical protein
LLHPINQTGFQLCAGRAAASADFQNGRLGTLLTLAKDRRANTLKIAFLHGTANFDPCVAKLGRVKAILGPVHRAVIIDKFSRKNGLTKIENEGSSVSSSISIDWLSRRPYLTGLIA